MELPPQTDLVGYKPAGKLPGRKAMVTSADSGVGRTVALALEGADVAIVCNENDGDAEETKSVVNDAAYQVVPDSLEEIRAEQFRRTLVNQGRCENQHRQYCRPRRREAFD